MNGTGHLNQNTLVCIQIGKYGGNVASAARVGRRTLITEFKERGVLMIPEDIRFREKQI